MPDWHLFSFEFIGICCIYIRMYSKIFLLFYFKLVNMCSLVFAFTLPSIWNCSSPVWMKILHHSFDIILFFFCLYILVWYFLYNNNSIICCVICLSSFSAMMSVWNTINGSSQYFIVTSYKWIISFKKWFAIYVFCSFFLYQAYLCLLLLHFIDIVMNDISM